MQDIPRDELLNKLAAGWKVRRNNWAKDCYIASAGSSTSCHWFDLLKDDWEGEPPEPVLKMAQLSVFLAFYQLKYGQAKFVRRPVWADVTKMQFDDPEEDTWFDLLAEDILANDWEVWE